MRSSKKASKEPENTKTAGFYQLLTKIEMQKNVAGISARSIELSVVRCRVLTNVSYVSGNGNHLVSENNFTPGENLISDLADGHAFSKLIEALLRGHRERKKRGCHLRAIDEYALLPRRRLRARGDRAVPLDRASNLEVRMFRNPQL